MKFLVAVLSLIPCLALGRVEDQQKQYNTFVPDSLVDSAATHLKNHVGDAVFRERIRFVGAAGEPIDAVNPKKYLTAWSTRYSNGEERSFGFFVNKDGSLAGKIPLPRCADHPETFEPQMDRAMAIAIAESTLGEQFCGEFFNCYITYEVAPCDCYGWYIEGETIADEGWLRKIFVTISDVNQSIISMGRSNEYPNDRDRSPSVSERLAEKTAPPNRDDYPDKSQLRVGHTSAISIADSALGEPYKGGYVDHRMVYKPTPLDCFAWEIFSGGPQTGDGWIRTGTVWVNAVDGSIIRIVLWEQWNLSVYPPEKRKLPKGLPGSSK